MIRFNLNFKVTSSQHVFTELVVCICVELAKIILMLLRPRGDMIWIYLEIICKLYKNIFMNILYGQTAIFSFKPTRQAKKTSHTSVCQYLIKYRSGPKTLHMFLQSKSIAVTAGIFRKKPKIAYWSKYKLNHPEDFLLRYKSAAVFWVLA